MSSAATGYEVGSRVLGYVGLVAAWRRSVGKPKPYWDNLLVIQTSAEESIPAQSITINSKEGLLALRDCINEALRGEEQ